jgi:hypothetical protein
MLLFIFEKKNREQIREEGLYGLPPDFYSPLLFPPLIPAAHGRKRAKKSRPWPGAAVGERNEANNL